MYPDSMVPGSDPDPDSQSGAVNKFDVLKL